MNNAQVASSAVIVLTALLGLAAGAAAAPAHVWLEGEAPAEASFEFETPAWGPALSGNGWLHFSRGGEQAPEALAGEGLRLRYDVEAPSAGDYEAWARIGFEWVRAPLEWRVNGGEWRRWGPADLTTNLIELGVWAEIGWARFGTVALREGANSLELRCTEAGRDGRLIVGLDCFAFVEGEGNFTPDGTLRPGEIYDAEADVEAREHVFRFPDQLPDSAAERVELPLDGPWQVARYDDPDMDADTYEPVSALPAPQDYELHWRGLDVPGDARARPELRFGHRLLCRTRVDVPAALEGRGFHLHFSGTNWIVGVFVNDEFVGGHTSVLVPWDMDITNAVRPGEVNTITVAVKSSWYALEPGEGETMDHMRNRPYEGDFKRNYRFVDAVYPSTKGEGDGLAVGIINPVKLVVTGPAYVSDVFVRTSVAGERLAADLTILNPSGGATDLAVDFKVLDEKTGAVANEGDPLEVTVQARETARVRLDRAWPGPKLWWPEPDPQLYVLRTTVSHEGEPVDVHEQLFGFREITIEGKDFLLNGVPWHFWNWVDVGEAHTEREWLANYRAHGDRFHRVASDHDRLWGYRERALEFFDRHGIPARLSTCIDGMFITHNLRNPLVWENFERHVRQVVRAYRNHPSVMMWSLGNEMMFITSRLAYSAQDNLRWMEKAQHLSDVARELDPTRPSFQDGGGDLNRRGDVNCQHYSWPSGGSVPTESYAYRLREGPWVPNDTWDRSTEQYAWDGRRPLVQGEVFYYSGNVSAMAWVGGPDVYRGKQYATRAAARYARIGVEGARWQGVTAICPWVILPEAAVSFAPRAAFVRQWNSCFRPGAELQRTIKVFNDGHSEEPLTLRWQLVLGGAEVAAGQKTYRVPPGHAEQDTLTAALPEADERMDGELRLTLHAGEERVFEDAKPISVLSEGPPVKGLTAGSLTVFDPEGSVRRWLEGRGQPFTPVSSVTALPEGCRVLVLGRDALPAGERQAVAGALRRFVEAGNTAIVLEQQHPLEGEELPAAGITVAGERADRPPRPEFRAAGGESGCIAFPVALAHPVLEGLAEGDFFTWSGDERSFRLSYATPSSGAISLVQAGAELRLTPMMDVRAGQGSYVLSQMLIAEKLAVEPVAGRLLHNALSWAAARSEAEPGRTVAYVAGDEALRSFLDRSGLSYEPAADLEALLGARADVAVVRATAGALQALAARRDEVRSYCAGGGWLMLVGVDEAGLAEFNALVGFDHRIRPFRREAVVLQARTDPLLMGLSDRDVNMVSDEMLAPWAHLYWISQKTFTAVVDGREVASFAGGNVGDVTNGMVNDDFWRYIRYLNADGAEVEFPFDRPETFTRARVWGSGSYYWMKDVELVFDDEDAVRFTLEKRTGVQELEFAPRTATKVTFRVVDHYPDPPTKDLVGLDNFELYRRAREDFDERVVLLTKPGGLVRYPIGQGGIVLNQLDHAVADTEENVSKKLAIYANLLRNMGASFGE
jgi:hypothetical protein